MLHSEQTGNVWCTVMHSLDNRQTQCGTIEATFSSSAMTQTYIALSRCRIESCGCTWTSHASKLNYKIRTAKHISLFLFLYLRWNANTIIIYFSENQQQKNKVESRRLARNLLIFRLRCIKPINTQFKQHQQHWGNSWSICWFWCSYKYQRESNTAEM